MTPREKNIAAVVSAMVATLVACGGFFAYGASRISEVQVLKSEVTTLKDRLDRMEKKQDETLMILLEIKNKR